MTTLACHSKHNDTDNYAPCLARITITAFKLTSNIYKNTPLQNTFQLFVPFLFVDHPAHNVTVIGGGIGGSVAVNHCNNKLAAAGPSSSCTPSLPPAAAGSTFLNYSIPTPVTGCRTSDFTTNYTSETGLVFIKACEHNYINSDIVGVVAPTWNLCMEACARYNAYRNSSNPTACVGITLVPSWINEQYSRGNISFWSNCFLKYEVPPLNTVKNAFPFEVVVSYVQSS